MIIAKVKYPPHKINPSFGEDRFLNDVKAYAIAYINTLYNSKRLDDRNVVKRLKITEQYIRSSFGIMTPIKEILKEVIFSLSFTEDKQFIQIPVNSKFSGIKIEQLYKIICYGSLSIKGSGNTNILKLALGLAFNYFINTGFITKWGWL